MTLPIPEKILCLCTENTVRSVMLEGLLSQYTQVKSAGLDPVSFSNPITEEVIQKNQVNFEIEDPKGLDDVSLDEFDLVIAVSEPAYEYLKQNHPEKAEVEYWVTAQPPLLGEISRDACLESYQNIFNELKHHIENRFDLTPE